MAMEKSFPLVFERLTILILFWTGTTRGDQQLCNNMNPETGSLVMLYMNTTQIIRQNGMCSCKLTVNNGARILMYPSITSPNCTTNIELIDIPEPYTFVCRNGKIDSTTTFSYINDHKTGDVFWLMVTSTVNIDHSLSGSIQIKSQHLQGVNADPTITVECYDPNTNSSSTTSTVATTLTSSTTSTVATTTTSSTVATTRSVMSSDSPTTTIQTTNPTTKGQTTSPPVTQDISTTNGQAVTETTPIHSQSSSFSPTSNLGGTGESGETTTPKVGQTDKSTNGNEQDFPVAAVAGGVAGGLVLILIIIITVTCSRRKRQKKPQLLENGDGPETNNHGHSYLNQSFEDRESNMTENGLYQPSNYHYDNPTDKQSNINKDDNTIKTSPLVSSSLPAEMDGGMYASADDLPQNQASANPVQRSSDIPDHYASVNEMPAFVPGDGPVESQEVAVSPSPYEDAIEPNTEVSPYEDAMEPHHEVSPSGDVYAVVNKVNQPKVSHEAVGDLASPEESEFQHDDEVDDEVNVVVDNAKQPNVSFEIDADPVNLETIRLHSGDHGDDEEEAALNMMKAVSEEEQGSNDDNDLTGSDDHDEAPIIQSTDL